jgi:hypothetical protein
MLEDALRLHAEGLCVIPVKPRDKAPLLAEWECYQTRCSTADEIARWWVTTPTANIGIVHGIHNYVALDFDDDAGLFAAMRAKFPDLFAGRIEQSGSGQGYHLPLFVETLPDLGWDNGKDRPKGNKTYRTDQGSVNIRARWCQTVAPPSIHPSGNAYRYIQAGAIIPVVDLRLVMAWLGMLDPKARPVVKRASSIVSPSGGMQDIKAYLPALPELFALLGISGEAQREPNGETRISGHGGLLITADETRWYCFSDETGGDAIDAWGWARFGAAWDRHNRGQFSQVIREIREQFGIGQTRQIVPAVKSPRRAHVWGSRLRSNYWSGK